MKTISKYRPRPSYGTPYVPSYMDLSNGPEPCIVCGDAATGYHYRCMTCEGCKGFFRRTIQKNLTYYCKRGENCVIDKSTRNQCQQCRYKKCLRTGMAPDLVLNEHQRKAKRRLIQNNRERRHKEDILREPVVSPNRLTSQEIDLINAISQSHRETCQLASRFKHFNISKDDLPNNGLSMFNTELSNLPDTRPTEKQRTHDLMNTLEFSRLPDTTKQRTHDLMNTPELSSLPDTTKQNNHDLINIAEIMTPSIVNIVEFAKKIPGFAMLEYSDQVLLLKSCCMEIMCMRIAQKYNPTTNTLEMSNGLSVDRSQLTGSILAELLEPIFDFAVGLSRLKLTDAEIALLSAVLLVTGDRPGLKNPKSVEVLQDELLTAFQHYVSQSRPKTPVYWAKILMKITDLRTISTRHADTVMSLTLDCPQGIPPMLLEVFDI
ncbi:thyroid hormone receptor beta-A-like [Antedon mediterranea]|uniref:thyroid hormone receptor beta-A-like n=1 Tax=Antedon mediterranea TaxID=105859 RepID=UPI003AF51D4B